MTTEQLEKGNELLKKIDELNKDLEILDCAFSVTINNENGYSLFSYIKNQDPFGSQFINAIRADMQTELNIKQSQFNKL